MAKNKKTGKLPKRIAGVKVPKTLRKNGGSLMALLDTPAVKALVASGLAAAAVTLSAGEKSGSMTVRKAKRRLEFAAGEGADRANEIVESVGQAVTAAMEKWFGGVSKPDKPVVEGAAQTVAKGKSRSAKNAGTVAH